VVDGWVVGGGGVNDIGGGCSGRMVVVVGCHTDLTADLPREEYTRLGVVLERAVKSLMKKVIRTF